MAIGGRALVTGGCGFIGVNLGRLLVSRGWHIVAFDDLSSGSRSDAEAAGYEDVVVGDVLDQSALVAATRGADVVVHLAAHTNVVESVEDPRHDVEVNVLGTLAALTAARDAQCRSFVLASANAPLGSVDPPTHEGLVPRPLSPYGASKLAGEALCSAFAGSYGLPCVALRFSNVYGPYSWHKGSVIARFLKDLSDGRPLTIFGDGHQTRDFVFVEDLCAGIASAMEGTASGVFHLGTGTETSVLELVELLRAVVTDHAVEVVHRPARPGEIDRNFSRIDLARQVLGFEPSVGLEEGIDRTYRWFQEALV